MRNPWDLQAGLIPLGFVSLGDVLRPQTRETLTAFSSAGVQLKIISGDNPHTVAVYVTLLILLIPGFPFTPRQSSLISLLTVGIPTVALAAWAKPGPTQRKTLLLGLVHFVLPATLTASLATLFVFLIAVALASSAGQPEAIVIATAYSTITVFVTVSGVLLLVFVEPPTRFLAGGDALSGDWRPTILAGALLVGLAVLLIIPPGRAFFELRALTLLNVAVIAGVALLWALLLRFIWRFRLHERLLGIMNIVLS